MSTEGMPDRIYAAPFDGEVFCGTWSTIWHHSNQQEFISMTEHKRLLAEATGAVEEALDREDICGLCGMPGADKFPHPEHWPGERVPDTELVHAECEKAECARAHAALTDRQREEALRNIR